MKETIARDSGRRDRRHRRDRIDTTTRAPSGIAATNRNGAAWNTRFATGSITPGCAAITSSSRRFTASTKPLGCKAMPARNVRIGLGGRQQRTDKKFGNIFDHHTVFYEYPSGVRVYFTCRRQDNCGRFVDEIVLGTKGKAQIIAGRIDGEKPWRFRGRKAEHVRRGAQGDVQKHPRRQADQQRPTTCATARSSRSWAGCARTRARNLPGNRSTAAKSGWARKSTNGATCRSRPWQYRQNEVCVTCGARSERVEQACVQSYLELLAPRFSPLAAC